MWMRLVPYVSRSFSIWDAPVPALSIQSSTKRRTTAVTTVGPRQVQGKNQKNEMNQKNPMNQKNLMNHDYLTHTNLKQTGTIIHNEMNGNWNGNTNEKRNENNSMFEKNDSWSKKNFDFISNAHSISNLNSNSTSHSNSVVNSNLNSHSIVNSTSIVNSNSHLIASNDDNSHSNLHLSNRSIAPLSRPRIERSASIVILGTPNAGKSKLMNVCIGSQISAVSPKSHTTRANVAGVVTEGDTQLVFWDTPGVMPRDPSKGIGMVLAQAWKAAMNADVAILMIDAARRVQDAEIELATTYVARFKNAKTRKVLVLNKIDLLVDRTELLPLVEKFSKMIEFDAVFMVSALQYDGVEDLKDFLFAMSKPSKWLFEPSAASAFTPQQLVSEIIREKLYQRLNQEIPYNIIQETSEWRLISQNEFTAVQRALKKSEDGTPVPETTIEVGAAGALRIGQILYVSKASAAKVVVGASGNTIRAITETAQADIEKALSKPVILSLIVKVGKPVDYAAPKNDIQSIMNR